MPEDAPLEDAVRAHLANGDTAAAATALIEGYGPEILGYLLRMTGNEAAALEVFSQVSEDLWRGLATFEGRASLRTWAYTVARHAGIRHGRQAERAGRLFTPLNAEALRVAEAVRSTTLPYLRTTEKDRVSRLRAALSPLDNEVLVLRVDRAMPWAEVAAITGHGEAALRKRFERIKERLRALLAAEAAGGA